MIRRGLSLASLLLLGACDAYAPVPPATYSTCIVLYQSFSEELQAAIAAKQNSDAGTALYHTDGAQMNLDVLLDRKCCRFADTCPASISL